jgi:hypothetical protein
MTALATPPKLQFLDANGAPLVGGKLYTYAAGTTTPQVTYTDFGGGTANANPVILDSRGEASVWLGTALYKMALYSATNVLIWTVDNIGGFATLAQLAASGGSNLVGFLQAGTGAVATTVQTKLRESVSVADFMSAAQKADVAAGTALVDTLDAFNAAIASFPDTLNTTFYKQGGTVIVPFGKYYLSNTLTIDRNIVLKGVGAPYGNATGGSILEFADNCDGILAVDYRNSPSNKQGAGLVIEGLYLKRKNTGGTVGSGISLKTTARIVNVSCIGFREHGIKIDASTSYSPASNANLWEVHSCQLAFNGQHGLYVNGADANAGAGYNVNAFNNSGFGIYDSSFLGNTYVACHTDANTLGAYKSDDANARNMFLGCYSESGQPPSSVLQPAMIVGGLHAAGTGSTDPFLDSGGSTYGGVVSQGNFGTGKMNIGIGQPLTSGTGLAFPDTGGTYGWAFNKAVGRWGYQWANLNIPAFIVFYDRTATLANGYTRTLVSATAPAGNNAAIGIDAHYVGSPTNPKWLGYGTAAPVSGNYEVGDTIYNTSPTAGGFIGWVCTTAGTPGTWKTFGAISP